MTLSNISPTSWTIKCVSPLAHLVPGLTELSYEGVIINHAFRVENARTGMWLFYIPGNTTLRARPEHALNSLVLQHPIISHGTYDWERTSRAYYLREGAFNLTKPSCRVYTVEYTKITLGSL